MPPGKPNPALLCPNCHEPVDPQKPNAMLSAVTNEWQHKDCWRARATIVSPEANPNNPRRDSR